MMSKRLLDWQAIDDSASIPAMEIVFSTNRSPDSAMMVVEKLRAMDDAEATRSLARHALFINDLPFRGAAIAALKKRPLEDYVPALLACLYTPSSVQAAAGFSQRTAACCSGKSSLAKGSITRM